MKTYEVQKKWHERKDPPERTVLLDLNLVSHNDF